MNIIYVYEDLPGGCVSNELRCFVPARAINRTKRHSAGLLNINEIGLNSQRDDEICSKADIIVIDRKSVV